jgi:hypothetical protein
MIMVKIWIKIFYSQIVKLVRMLRSDVPPWPVLASEQDTTECRSFLRGTYAVSSNSYSSSAIQNKDEMIEVKGETKMKMRLAEEHEKDSPAKCMTGSPILS